MIALGVVGLGKIAHDQHLPTIAAASDFTLVATVSPGAPVSVEERHDEYPQLYTRFAELIRARSSDFDDGPLRLVADAMLIGTRHATEPFFF